jgi:hypothetical protein
MEQQSPSQHNQNQDNKLIYLNFILTYKFDLALGPKI